jgi:hypothetical protein
MDFILRTFVITKVVYEHHRPFMDLNLMLGLNDE